MKISKLFHWLYAILMFLPIMVFIPNAFYYGFNKEALAEVKTESNYVQVDFNQLANNGNWDTNYVYTNYTGCTIIVDNNVATFTINTNSSIGRFGFGGYLYQGHTYLIEYDARVLDNAVVYSNIWSNGWGSSQTLITDSWTTYYRIVTKNAIDSEMKDYPFGFNTSYSTIGNQFQLKNCMIFDLSQMFYDSFIPTYEDFKYLFPNEYYSYVLHDTIIVPLGSISYNMAITDSMCYAWESVWQNDLFSWSYGSFLTQPFIYIGSVFNIPVDNTLYYALSYWLDISIIWLCFDVILYVPLLVHRWLDKGIVE